MKEFLESKPENIQNRTEFIKNILDKYADFLKVCLSHKDRRIRKHSDSQLDYYESASGELIKNKDWENQVSRGFLWYAYQGAFDIRQVLKMKEIIGEQDADDKELIEKSENIINDLRKFALEFNREYHYIDIGSIFESLGGLKTMSTEGDTEYTPEEKQKLIDFYDKSRDKPKDGAIIIYSRILGVNDKEGKVIRQSRVVPVYPGDFPTSVESPPRDYRD